MTASMDEAFWYVQIPFRLCHCGRSSCGRGYCGQGFVPASYVQGVVRGGVFTAYLVLFVVCLGAFSAETTQQRARLAGISGECMMELSESVTRGGSPTFAGIECLMYAARLVVSTRTRWRHNMAALTAWPCGGCVVLHGDGRNRTAEAGCGGPASMLT